MRLVAILGSCQLMLLMACQSAAPIATDQSASSTPTLPGSAASSSTPALGIDLRVPPTRAPRPSPAATASSASPSAGTSASAGAGVSVTLADDGGTVTLHAGQRVLVNLGEELDWTVQVEDESIVSRVPGVTVIRGAQGLYQAARAGQTVLNATGDPACRKQVPACGLASRIFKVTVVVQ